MPDKRTDALEEKLAHLQRVADELSEVVARQATELERLDAPGRDADAARGRA